VRWVTAQLKMFASLLSSIIEHGTGAANVGAPALLATADEVIE